ncbi:hypothetical protein DY023_11615 [Microbacterium bovistercoris]|uniref:DUF3558 domain-containing protein n=1 Tax=Microbacterium bovistercoris TaxID=2293570 RepID=A0A371NRW6_9MICO|nr:hypothetical protein [Microbacterium bovistercoris]REJ04899.1 hypothetical protein DY023_11615 [Microbacterium bovistercoris]
MRAARVFAIAAAVAASVLLAGCAPAASDPGGAGKTTSSTTKSTDAGDKTPSPSATPTPTVKPAAIPKDCRKVLNDDVLAQLKDVPLNDKAFGPSGTLDDGSLKCIWGDPQADTTGLTTTIQHKRSGAALDQLNALMADGFTCYTPDEGTRCEKIWKNETYPVTDGRTLFYRQGVLIDTQYSNLAPKGYTDAIIASIWG